MNKRGVIVDDFFVAEPDSNLPWYNVKAAEEYCKKNNKTTDDLTDEELKIFEMVKD